MFGFRIICLNLFNILNHFDILKDDFNIDNNTILSDHNVIDSYIDWFTNDADIGKKYKSFINYALHENCYIFQMQNNLYFKFYYFKIKSF